jgi:hypothetical protein
MDAAKADITDETLPEFITEGLQPIYRGVLCNNPYNCLISTTIMSNKKILYRIDGNLQAVA